MKYFQEFSSNTLAGSGNQSYFLTEDESRIYTGRIFYQIFAGGTYRYSLLFSNILDSTYADGSHSHKNLICDSWEIVKASAGLCPAAAQLDQAADSPCFHPLTFSGAAGKAVMPGEFFATDPLELTAGSGEYFCLEISYRGRMIPYHDESIIPAFIWSGGAWKPSKQMPFPGMVGCDRPAALKVGYLGDSITQGIGTQVNSYDHWNAKLSRMLGRKYAYWNLGLGYGRASDAASDGAWLFKAKQMDAVVVCYGVNDLLKGSSEEQLKRDLTEVTAKLQAAGVRVLLQTIPPFDYTEPVAQRWRAVNRYILGTLSQRADRVFDVVPILAEDPVHDYCAKYGGHPNAAGCKEWAEALYPVMKDFLESAF